MASRVIRLLGYLPDFWMPILLAFDLAVVYPHGFASSMLVFRIGVSLPWESRASKGQLVIDAGS